MPNSYFQIGTADVEKVSQCFSLFLDGLQKPVPDDADVKEAQENTKEASRKRAAGAS